MAEAAHGAGLPQFVEREFREFLTCSVFKGGVARFPKEWGTGCSTIPRCAPTTSAAERLQIERALADSCEYIPPDTLRPRQPCPTSLKKKRRPIR